MPSLLGGFISIIVAGTASAASAEAAGLLQHPHKQALAQFWGILVCFSFAVLTGVFTGVVMSKFRAPAGVDVREFHDAVWWEIGGGEYELVHKEEEAVVKQEVAVVEMIKCSVGVADVEVEMEPTISVQGSSEETI